MPEYLRYTTPIPFTKPIAQALGLGNTDLVANLWGFFSFMQQYPGSSAYKIRQLEELGADTSASGIQKVLTTVHTIAETFGMGMWPGIEWMLGVYGLLGNDWYPNKWIGTYVAIPDFVINNVFRKNDLMLKGGLTHIDFDYWFKERVPEIWNALWLGVPRLQWRQLNPDLMESIMYGRQETIEYTKLPNPAAAALTDLTPSDAEKIVNAMTPEEQESYAERMEALFKLTDEQLIEKVTTLDEKEKAIFMHLIEVHSLRKSVAKQFITTILGTTTGLYANYNDDELIQAYQMRFNSRKAQQELGPGQARRDAKALYEKEHPQLQLVQNFVYSTYPYAETSAGLLAEQLDSKVSDAKGNYWNYLDEFYTKMNDVMADINRQNPGNIALIRQEKADFYAQLDAQKKIINDGLNADIAKAIKDYRTRYPNDTQGLKKLMDGFETPMYTSPQLSDENRKMLLDFKTNNPNDIEGYDRLYTMLINSAIATQTTQGVKYRKVPGFKDGYNMDVQWDITSSPNYTEEEIQKRLLDDVMIELQDGMPKRADYTNGTAYWLASQAYMDDLPNKALTTQKMQIFIDRLMKTQGMTEEEAKKQASELCTKDTLYAMWRENDTLWDALEYVYKNYYINSADLEWFDTILPLSKTGNKADYAKYSAMKEDLDSRYGPIDAYKMIKFIQQDYPGKWTTAELMKEFEGVTMPSYFTRLVLQSEGEAAIDANIRHIF